MVSKYYNVNLRMPNYWSSGVLRKTGNKIVIFLAPDYILGEYKDSKFFLTLYNTQFLSKYDGSKYMYKTIDVNVEFEIKELLPEGEILPFQVYKFVLDYANCSLEIKSEIDDLDEQINLEENCLKNIPK